MKKAESGPVIGRFFLGCLIFCLAFAGCSREKPPLTNEAYIWQRVWTPAVKEAIAGSRAQLTGYVVLGGEIAWTKDGPTFVKAQVDFAALQKEKIGIALRIGPYKGPFLPNDPAATFIREKVQTILQEAVNAGVMPTELQIDFDCAQSKLGGYRVWLEMIQVAAGKWPVRITVLPSWLKEPAFKALVRKSDGFILQVHSVQKPVVKGESPKIFDEKLALIWVEQAADLRRPFRIALPTYTNQIISNAEGKVIRIAAEEAQRLLPANVTSQFSRSDAQEVALFLQKLPEKRLPHLQGILWYRLPLSTDRMNWRWETLRAVIEHQPLQSQLKFHCNNGDLSLENTGNIDAEFPLSLSASWSESQLIAADALPGWMLERESKRIIFHPDALMQEGRLPPNGKLAIGWVRLEPAEKIHAQIP